MSAASSLKGSIASNNAQMVRAEQTIVQAHLSTLQKQNPVAYQRTIDQINSALSKFPVLGSASGADRSFNQALQKTQREFGGKTQFELQRWRERLGLNVINENDKKASCPPDRKCAEGIEAIWGTGGTQN